jgi:8-oxo-dGTP pyrophosphatase MutT (NUDIX family)
METLNQLLQKITNETFAANKTKNEFAARINEREFGKDKNPFSHFCVYFPAYDPQNKLVFIGHHKKSGLWLFNGGHMEKNESPYETLEREIKEEWGIEIKITNGIKPELLTITKVENNPAGRLCKIHYDIWFFLPQDSKSFAPDKNLLQKEFHEIGWKTFEEARLISKDANTIAGIGRIEKIICK